MNTILQSIELLKDPLHRRKSFRFQTMSERIPRMKHVSGKTRPFSCYIKNRSMERSVPGGRGDSGVDYLLLLKFFPDSAIAELDFV